MFNITAKIRCVFVPVQYRVRSNILLGLVVAYLLYSTVNGQLKCEQRIVVIDVTNGTWEHSLWNGYSNKTSQTPNTLCEVQINRTPKLFKELKVVTTCNYSVVLSTETLELRWLRLGVLLFHFHFPGSTKSRLRQSTCRLLQACHFACLAAIFCRSVISKYVFAAVLRRTPESSSPARRSSPS